MKVKTKKKKYVLPVLNNKDLHKRYAYLKDRYFPDMFIPVFELEFRPMKEMEIHKKTGKWLEGEWGIYPNGQHFIHISEDLKTHPLFAELTLLHEMIHQYLAFTGGPRADHGYRFGYELTRLWNNEAFEGLL